MNLRFSARMVVICVGLLVGLNAQARTDLFSYALKSGESVEVSDLYWVINCRSQLTSLPEVTILDGPQGVTATVTEAMVLPRTQQCSKPVEGGKLKLTATKIEVQSNTIMTIRVKYKTKDGDRSNSISFNIALFP